MAASFVRRPLTWWKTVRSEAVDFVFPPRCVHCQQSGTFLCSRCAQEAEPAGDEICLCCGRRQQVRTPLCIVCQERERPLSLVRAAALHRGPIRNGIHQLKYGGAADLAPLLARYLVAAFLLDPWPLFYWQIDGVVPVPLHQERRRERGYNQAELLAQAFCQRVNLPLQSAWLARQRFTHSQVGLHARQRQANVENAFVAAPAVRGKRILLIDDVYTTGATLNACATAALAVGASVVYGLTLALPALIGGEAVDDSDR
jgi:ComF family protein